MLEIEQRNLPEHSPFANRFLSKVVIFRKANVGRSVTTSTWLERYAAIGFLLPQDTGQEPPMAGPMTEQGGFARRLNSLQAFKVMKLLARAQQLEELGHDVIHMEVGEPDFPTPAPIVQAGLEALRSGKTRYTAAEGIWELRQAIARFYADHIGVDVEPDRIFVTAGGSGALLLSVVLLIDKDEGLLMTDPGYPCNRHFLTSFHGEGQLVPVTPDDGYQLSGDLVKRHWRENTRGALVASPANPTGAMLSETQMQGISESVRARGGQLIVDEIYQGLTYQGDDNQPTTMLRIDKDAFILNSFSKYFGMTGWRLGWLVAPEAAVSDLQKLAQNLFICPSSIAQHAALAAFSDESLKIMESQRRTFADRKDLLVPALKAVGFDIPREPEGAFYVYARLPGGSDSSEKFCDRLLENYFVAATPGTDFGFYLAEQHVRFTYAQPADRLTEAVGRIEKALHSGL